MIERPIFLVAAERSGTTLLRLMLAHHPEIAFLSEFNFITDLIGENGALPRRARVARHLAEDRCFRDTRLVMHPELEFVDHANSLLEQGRVRDGATLIGATVHRHFDRLLTIWPDARFIHLVRDGRDVALSTVKMGWAGNAYSAIKTWIAVERLWSEMARRLPSDRYVSLRYEDLIPDPEGQLTRICDFLGVAYDPAMLRYPADTTYAAPDATRVRAWQKTHHGAVRAAEGIAAPWLALLGYPVDPPAGTVSLLKRAQLRIHNRLARARFKRQRYSLPLWLEDVLARRIGTPRWRSHVRDRIERIDSLYIQ